MRRLPLRFLLALATVLTAAGASCGGRERGKTRILHPVGDGATLSLDLRFPEALSEDATCGGTARGSYLLRLDTASSPAGDWDYALLFDATASTLYGCGGPATACPEPDRLGFKLPPPARVMLEALDAAPAGYAAAPAGVNVLCRGVADVQLGDIVSTALPAPTGPTAQPTNAPSVEYRVTLRMLRVGASNPLPYDGGTAPPHVRFAAAAGFVDLEHGIGSASTGADVVIAGGLEESGSTYAYTDRVHRFSPATLAFTEAGTLQSARGGLGASIFRDSSGVGILFAGGATDPGAPSSTAHADVVRPSGVSAAAPMTTPRAFPALILLGAGAGQVIFVAGGSPYEAAAASPFPAPALATFEYFVPAGATLPMNCAQAAAFCNTGGGAMAGARATAVALAQPGGTTAWVVGGVDGATVRQNVEGFNPLGGGGAGSFAALSGTLYDLSAFPAAVRLSGTGVAGVDGRVLAFGGFKNAGTRDAHNGIRRGDASTLGAMTNTLRLDRGALQATVLRDHTVLLTGGDDGADGIAVVERFVPRSTDLGYTEFLAPVPAGACTSTTSGAGAGCVALEAPRWGHTATRIEGSGTWLDGAVLIAGGSLENGYPPAELFVPAYRCASSDHRSPVSPSTQVAADPMTVPAILDLCDRDRAGTPVTDPLTGR